METILKDSDRAEVKKLFGAIKDDVFVDLYVKRRASIVLPGQPEEDDEEDVGLIAEQLLTEVASLSPNLKLAIHDASTNPAAAKSAGVEGMNPTLVFRNAESKGTLRYFGLPAGYEFKTLIDTIVALGAKDDGLTDESKAELARLTSPVNLKVYVTPG